MSFVKVNGGRAIVMDLNEDRLAFCREHMGVSDTVLVDGTELEQLQALTNGEFCEVVIDATGHNGSMSNALEFVAFGGRLVYVGITSDKISFLHPLMHRREMTLLASRNAHSADFGEIINLIESGKINTDAWITHRTDMDRLAADFPTFLKPESGVLKAMIEIS